VMSKISAVACCSAGARSHRAARPGSRSGKLPTALKSRSLLVEPRAELLDVGPQVLIAQPFDLRRRLLSPRRVELEDACATRASHVRLRQWSQHPTSVRMQPSGSTSWLRPLTAAASLKSRSKALTIDAAKNYVVSSTLDREA
jgi:hypothetical protein